MSQLVPFTAANALPALITAAGDQAGRRFLEFFAANIRNPHTRRAYGRAVADFLVWCDEHGVTSIAAVQPLHVATWIEMQTRKLSAPTVKQHLAAIRHVFDWLVTGQVVPTNPAASVRGPAHTARTGKTPVLELGEARALLDAIDITTPAGLRDRALIGLMVYSFARVGAALGMKVEDVFTQTDASGCDYARRVARLMPCLATTTLRPTSQPTSTRRDLPRIPGDRCSGR